MFHYGQFRAPEFLKPGHHHFYRGEPLREVNHEPKCGVLDQQDLFAQGIYVSHFIPGARDVDALGSCTANATTVAMSNVLPEDEWCNAFSATSFTDVKGAEEGAIQFYHACTSQTATPQSEWPPTDCGSSGPYIAQELERSGLIAGDKVAHDATSIVSLMQATGLLVGGPFLNVWESPASNGFVDGDGSVTVLERQVSFGVAGGHERYASAIETLVLTETGRVTAEKTVIRERNSWSRSWGDNGSFRLHLSTYVYLGAYMDFRRVVPCST